MASMLGLLGEVTRVHQPGVDEHGLALLVSGVSTASYRAFLARRYGFEAPVESAFANTPQLAGAIDLCVRAKARLLRDDLVALGETRSPATIAPPMFARPTDALGWMYVVERHTLVHGQLRRHLERANPQAFRATSYLGAYDRALGQRWRELGEVLDDVARSPAKRDRVIESAHAGFRHLHGWLSEHAPTHRRAA